MSNFSKNMDTFAKRLKQLRLESGLTLEELAAELQISPLTLKNYENSVRKPRVAYLCKIGDFYDVRINWLCGLDDIRK